jgi:TonB family protein
MLLRSVTTLAPPLRHALLVSLGVHVVALTALGFTLLPAARQVLEVRRSPFAGQQVVVSLSFAQPALELPPLPDLPPVESPMLVTPHEVQFEHRTYIDKTTAELDQEPATTARPREVVEIPLPKLPQAQRDAQAASAPPSSATARTEATLPRTPREVQPRAAAASVPPQVAGVDSHTPAKLHNNRPPRYPDIAKQNRWEGTVLLKLSIDAQGRVTDVAVLRSSGHPVLDAEAAAAVRIWRGEPALQDGQPVASEEQLPVRFRL